MLSARHNGCGFDEISSFHNETILFLFTNQVLLCYPVLFIQSSVHVTGVS